ncbi:nucleotidyltransferase family protein [Rhizorhapis sp. SPR117]|uniref:nucleotidyltransferase family protein n=1 Tax=Rhizorhapis sp. SPR117 TaxID=2912611 RepID=UPI001F25B691|nr:nucleotidyltransferase family protein [Rhizorhapis sp. SPR117]
MKTGDVGIILLAAGRSSRFGRDDKLAAPLRGQPLAGHVAKALSSIGVGCRIAVCSQSLPVDWHALGFDEVRIPEGNVLSASIAAGITRLRGTDLKACLIALADMPFIPASHFEALIAKGANPVLATGQAGNRMVPALFSRQVWDDLSTLSGDIGARQLLKGAPCIEAPAQWLADIDTPDDLARFTTQGAGLQ